MWRFDSVMALLVVVLGASGSYLMLPHRHGLARPRMTYAIGAASAGIGLLVFIGFWSPPGDFLSTVFFYVFSVAAIIGGLLTVTSRNPVYSALWFASVVLATSGLFLLAGAPFLAAGTVIVYAGAIIVTFLFVIMLAQLEGRAVYDRAARAPGAATFTCFLLLWCLIVALASIKTKSAEAPASRQEQMTAEHDLSRAGDLPARFQLQQSSAILSVLYRARGPSAGTLNPDGSEKPSVAGIGEALYTDHLISAGLAGALLFVALIGAIAIINPRRSQRYRSRGPMT